MRVPFVVYGVLYVVIEMVGYQLELIGWPQITALDVASALADALLWIALVAAVLVALDVAADRWRRHLRGRQRKPAWVPATSPLGRRPSDHRPELAPAHAGPALGGDAPGSGRRPARPAPLAPSGLVTRVSRTSPPGI
jgi:hypothetical protein